MVGVVSCLFTAAGGGAAVVGTSFLWCSSLRFSCVVKIRKYVCNISAVFSLMENILSVQCLVKPLLII